MFITIHHMLIGKCMTDNYERDLHPNTDFTRVLFNHKPIRFDLTQTNGTAKLGYLVST